jgi:MYXO-CTERM domain-containing protein
MRKLAVMLGCGAVLASAVLAERDAEACGGCFVPQPPPGETESVITDHRMILSVSPVQTTLYDEIRYQGNPSSFAWVLPINGDAKVGLSSDTLFQALDRTTSTVVQAPNPNCPAPPSNCNFFGGADGTQTPSAGAADAGAVIVTHEETVGPYETVQLHSTDPNALNAWLTSHGYQIPTDVQPVIAAYVTEHFDFLALKLVPGAGVQSMRPVRVTTAGASPVLPLRMVAAGTGATVGITLWVVADGRWEPQNFPSFTITDKDLVWDWTSSSSNYTTLRTQNEANLGGRGWEIESSTSQTQQTIRQYVLSLGRFPGVGPDAGPDYLPVTDPDSGVVTETSDAVRNEDLDTLFAGIGQNNGQVRITRVRSDLVHAALVSDLSLQAATDQSVLSNVRQVTRESGEPLCPVYGANCQQTGTVPRSQAQAATKSSFSCAATPEAASSTLMGLGVAGLIALVGIGKRRRRS